MIIGLSGMFFAQSCNERNLYIMLPAIAVFMFALMQLSSKVPSKNQENDQDHV